VGEPIPSDRVLELMLIQGMRTAYAGGFLLAPFLQWLDFYNAVKLLGGRGEGSYTPSNLALITFNQSLYMERISHLNDVTDPGLAVLSGVARLPDQRIVHNWLASVKEEGVEAFQYHQGKKHAELGLMDGSEVSYDYHPIPYWGNRDDISEGWHPTRNRKMRVFKPMYAFDNLTRRYIYVRTWLSTSSPKEVIPLMVSRVREILRFDPLYHAFDREFYSAELFNILDGMEAVFVTMARNYPTIVRQMKDVNEEEFENFCEGNEIADVYLDVNNYEGDMRFVVIKLVEEKRLVAVITSDKHTDPGELVKVYSRRFGVDLGFKSDIQPLNLDKLPGSDPHKANAGLAIKAQVHNVVTTFQEEVSGRFARMEIAGIMRKFLERPGTVKLEGDEIVVKLDYFKGQEALEDMYENLTQKLANKGVDPRIPWLNNHTLRIEFGEKVY